MKYLILMLMAASAQAAPLVGTQDLQPVIGTTITWTAPNVFASSVILPTPAFTNAGSVRLSSGDFFNVYGATIDASYFVLLASTSYHVHINLLNTSGNVAGFYVMFGTGAVGGFCNTGIYSVNQLASNGNAVTYFGLPIFFDNGQTGKVATAAGNNAVVGDFKFETPVGSSTTMVTQFIGIAGYSVNAGPIMAVVAGNDPTTILPTRICITGSSNYFTAAVTKDQKFSIHWELYQDGPTHQ